MRRSVWLCTLAIGLTPTAAVAKRPHPAATRPAQAAAGAPARPGTPLGAADRAAAETMLIALADDPLAEEPLAQVMRIYERGPGLPSLIAECRRREPTAPASWAVVEGRIDLLTGHRVEGLQALSRAVDVTRQPRALRRLGQLLDEHGGRAAAIKAYRAGLADATPFEQRAILLRLGTLSLADNKLADARSMWAQAKRLAPSDQTLRRQMAEAFTAHGLWHDAITELEELEPLLASEPLSLLTVVRREAELARRLGNRTLAIERLVHAYLLAAKEQQSAAQTDIVAELMREHAVGSGAAQRARLDELLKLVRKQEATDPAAVGLEAELLAARGDQNGAIDGYRRLLALHPNDPYALRRLSQLESGPARIRDLTALVDVERNDPTAALDLVVALLKADRAREAITQARLVRERFNSSPLVLAELGHRLAEAKQHDEALLVDKRVFDLDPRQPDAIVAYGDELRAVGREREAIDTYWQLVGSDQSVHAFRQLIDVLRDRKLETAIKRAYREALTRLPGDQLLRRDFAVWLSASGNVDEALAEWRRLAQGTQDAFLREYANREIKRLETQQMLNR